MAPVDQSLYDATMALMRGKTRLPPAHGQLARYMEREYGIRVVNVMLDVLAEPEPHPHLRIFALGVRELLQRLNAGGEAQGEQALNARLRADYLWLTGGKDLPPGAPADKLSAELIDFQQDVEEETIRVAVLVAVPRLQKTYRRLPLWRLENVSATLYVFFKTRGDVDRYAADGTCARLAADYTEQVRVFDEFHLYDGRNAPVVFDSKQRVDEEFGGGLSGYYG